MCNNMAGRPGGSSLRQILGVTAVFALVGGFSLPANAGEVHARTEWRLDLECQPGDALPGSTWLDRVQLSWRPLEPRERLNVEVIHREFTAAGHSDALAFAAIVNAFAESALDETARMSDPFYWNGIDYPNGTGAIGLFQLLPSKAGAGGPSGPERGYSKTFMDGRWAGTRYQAKNHFDEPDARGRRYYDGTDPVLNTQRIILEVERDGFRLMKAERAGASIAELSYLFGMEIERPQYPTHARRVMAVEMLGRELALSRNPEQLFADPVKPRVKHPQCAIPKPEFAELQQSEVPMPAASVRSGGWLSLFGVFAAALSGIGAVVRFG